jgi:hypothetical protein
LTQLTAVVRISYSQPLPLTQPFAQRHPATVYLAGKILRRNAALDHELNTHEHRAVIDRPATRIPKPPWLARGQ